MDYENTIKTDDHGMCSGETYYTIEELYQSFKERMALEALGAALEQEMFNLLENTPAEKHDSIVRKNKEEDLKRGTPSRYGGNF